MSDLIKRWRKLSENKKMIHSIPQVMQMITMLEEQENKITELDNEIYEMAEFNDINHNDCEILIAKNTELEKALLWSRDSNTGFEPSVSVMQRYYDKLLPKGGAE